MVREADAVPSPQPRPISALLRDRTFGPFFAGKVLSSSGVWVQNISAAVLMYELTRSAFLVGAVSMSQFLAPLVLALWTGALNDRYDRRKLLLAGRLTSGSAVGTLSVLLVLRGVDGFGGPVALLVAVLVMGIGLALSAPAMQALVPALVPREDMEQALALSSAAPSISRMAGPALGAALLLAGGPALAFGVSASSHVFFVAVLLRIRGRRVSRPRSRPSALGGLRYLFTDRNAGKLMLGVGAIGVGADPVVTLTPAIADALGYGSDLVGVLATAFGAGGFLFLCLFGPLRRRLTLRALGMGGFWVLVLGLATAAFAQTPLQAVAGFAVAGTGCMTATVALNTRIQRRVPEELRGRVMALWSVAFLGSRPFAAALNGSVADLVSLRAALLTAGAVILLASLLARTRYGTAPEPL